MPPCLPPLRRDGGAAFLLAALLLLAPPVIAASDGAGEGCAPWPGEPTPLPTVDEDDSFRAGWAGLRREELSRMATALEIVAPHDAHRFWRHAACLGPESAEIAEGLSRTRSRAVHRPRLEAGHGPTMPARYATIDRAVASLGHTVWVPEPERPEPPRCGPRCQRIAALDRELAEIERLIRNARFHEAVSAVEVARTHAEEAGESRSANARRVRVEVLDATTQVALGDWQSARARFQRALEFDPALGLGDSTPPKVRRLFEEARTGSSADEGLDG